MSISALSKLKLISSICQSFSLASNSNDSLMIFFRDKEQEQADIDAEATVANTNLQKADSNLSHLKTQLNQKKSELKSGSSLTVSSPSQANPRRLGTHAQRGA
jgi:ATP phosphoribosyltransferase regulatory subunit HisZ